MALKPEVSLTIAAATSAVVYGIFQMQLPNMATVKGAQPHNSIVAGSTSSAGWEAAAVVAGISLLAKDPTVFVVGGAMAAVLTWKYKHANMVHPATGQVVMPPTYSNNGQTTQTQAS